MRNYELIYILRPGLEDDDKNAILEKVKNIIEDGAGVLDKVDVWGERKLAYEINKYTEGYYVLIVFKAGVAVPKEVDRNLKINDKVIRHMIVNTDED